MDDSKAHSDQVAADNEDSAVSPDESVAEAAEPDAPTLEGAGIKDGVTMFLSSFGGHPHEGLAARVQGICDSLGLQLVVVDFAESPQLRKAVLLQLRVFAQVDSACAGAYRDAVASDDGQP